jgi:hypothetical protein
MDSWMSQAMPRPGGGRLGYQTERDTVTMGLLQRAGIGDWEEFTCLGSLRDVEPSVGLILDERVLDDGYAVTPAAGATP